MEKGVGRWRWRGGDEVGRERERGGVGCDGGRGWRRRRMVGKGREME